MQVEGAVSYLHLENKSSLITKNPGQGGRVVMALVLGNLNHQFERSWVRIPSLSLLFFWAYYAIFHVIEVTCLAVVIRP